MSTDSIVSLAVGGLLTKIWNPRVSKDPPLPLIEVSLELLELVESGKQSGTIANPDGRRATEVESPPFITICIAPTSTAEYTMSEPDASVCVSCSINMAFWFVLAACNVEPIQN